VQGKILIVDSIPTNRIVLKVKLAAAFYEVLQAASIEDACSIALSEAPDLVITGMSLSDGTAADLCNSLSSDPLMRTIPTLAIAHKCKTADRLAALAAGAQDVMHKPLDDVLLLARVRSMIRAHNSAEEWQMRDDTSRALGFAEDTTEFGPPGRTTIVTHEPDLAIAWMSKMQPQMRATLNCMAPDAALRDLSQDEVPDVFVLVLSPTEHHSGEVMRLLAAIRATAATRHCGLLVVQRRSDPSLGAYALDLGADDLMTDGFDPTELSLRVKALMRRKRIGDQLRATVRTGLKAAVSDPLTGLHNRRYAMPHLTRTAEHAAATGKPFAVMVADLDLFKRINDLHGHAAGDAVLIETARRMRDNLRAVDMIARIGGEEFLIVMPGASVSEARVAARRLCRTIGGEPFNIPGADDPVTVTVSIGLTMGGLADASGDIPQQDANSLLAAADKALYAAKMRGRNQVTLRRPAA
jgi:two-component system cell cycle response regulator